MSSSTKGFVVAAQRRPSGTPYWVVHGSIGGRQTRKEFSDRAAALQFQEQRNSELFGTTSTHRVFCFDLGLLETRRPRRVL